MSRQNQTSKGRPESKSHHQVSLREMPATPKESDRVSSVSKGNEKKCLKKSSALKENINNLSGNLVDPQADSKVKSDSRRARRALKMAELETKLVSEYEERISHELQRLRRRAEDDSKKLEIQHRRDVFAVEVKLLESEKARDRATDQTRMLENQLKNMKEKRDEEAETRLKAKDAQITRLVIQLSKCRDSFEKLAFDNRQTNDMMETITDDYAKLKCRYDALAKEKQQKSQKIIVEKLERPLGDSTLTSNEI